MKVIVIRYTFNCRRARLCIVLLTSDRGITTDALAIYDGPIPVRIV